MYFVDEAFMVRRIALLPLLLASGALVPQANAVQFFSQSPDQCTCTDSEGGKKAGSGSSCDVSKLRIREDHQGDSGFSLSEVQAIYGGIALSTAQRDMVTLAQVATTSLQCLDDRVSEPAIATPGGDLGEFILALASYLTERDTTGDAMPAQQTVDSLLEKYVESMPKGRPMVHCTDDRAVAHLESEIPMENLDLTAPPDHAKSGGLLQKLTEVENQGDSHIRLMLKHPEYFQVSPQLVPMVLKSYYSLLWKQSQDSTSPLYGQQKLKLNVLTGTANPQAFLEVSSSELCQKKGVAPMLVPRTGQRSVLISHLDAVSLRREELASFFARIANASPRKVDRQKLHQRLDRHGWLALETTGSRIAAGLPFYSLTYQ